MGQPVEVRVFSTAPSLRIVGVFIINPDNFAESRPTATGGELAFILLRRFVGIGIRTTVERFDWRAASTLCGKNKKPWDAIKQLIRYKEVVGRETVISAESLQSGELFLDVTRSAE